LVVAGDATLAEIKPKLETLFRDWQGGTVPEKNISTVAQQLKPIVYLMDRPGSQQSLLFAGNVAPPKANPEEVAIETLNNILGGTFTSRINMNLREDKHWSYGAGSVLAGARGQRPFIVYTSVQADKTKESMAEINKELREILSKRPVTDEEVNKNKNNEILELPGSWETMQSVGSSMNNLLRYGLPDNYYLTYPEKIRQLTIGQVEEAAQKILHPDNLVWVVVGDRLKVENGIQELGLGEIRLIDADGNLIH
jgi:zinc protease